MIEVYALVYKGKVFHGLHFGWDVQGVYLKEGSAKSALTGIKSRALRYKSTMDVSNITVEPFVQKSAV